MIRSFAGVLAFLLIAAGFGAPGPAVAAGPVLVASSRCNSRMINDYASQIRDWEGHPPRGNVVDLQKRFNDINDVLQSLGQERGVLESVCSTDAEKTPLFTQLSAVAAVGLALESDIAIRIDQPCTPAAKAIAQALLAQAWLNLASTVNDAGGTVAPDVTATAPKVQTRAAAIDLKLPAYPETSAYWRSQITDQAKAAIQACATPPPSPGPSVSPAATLQPPS